MHTLKPIAPLLALTGFLSLGSSPAATAEPSPRPNILFAISDDQSWAHTTIAGDPVVKTPAFDRVARTGVLFTHAFCSAPSCTPSRGAILTGRNFWELEQGANLWSSLPAKFTVYPDLLEKAGYHVGYTRKGWGPGKIGPTGRTRNPAGNRYGNFQQFLEKLPEGKPFCFWFGSTDPHRPYKNGSGRQSGKKPEDVRLPPFLPDDPVVRNDILDYYVEVERFDTEVGKILDLIEKAGKQQNTLVVVTGDNGFPFPRGKCNLYDFGTRMPLAICWPAKVKAGRTVDDFISFTDFAPTFLEAAGLEIPHSMTGRSFYDVLTSANTGRVDPARDKVFFGKERHTVRRAGGVGYPCRAVRTRQFLYIRNLYPDRTPAGDPPHFGDVDTSPAKSFMINHRDDERVRPLFDLAFGQRPAEELYDLAKDSHQMKNVASDPTYADAKAKLRAELDRYRKETGDPRAANLDPGWDKQPYYGRRDLPEK